MQRVQVDKSGTELAYIDYGAPSTDTYTTLVCVHGHSYHAQSFSRIFPLAQNHDLRIVALNRRDYVGSTLFSQTELHALKEGDEEVQNQFLKARGLEIAQFLVWVIKELKIPRPNEDGTSGGLALLGWSLGNITTTAFLANLSTYPNEVLGTLEPYLRTLVMYELPDNTLGYPRPEGYYHPYEDTSIPARIKGIIFGKWVSSYYEHPAYAPEAQTGVESRVESSSVFPPGKRSIDSLHVRAPKKATRPCTLDNISPRDLLACVDVAPGPRSEWALWRLPLPLLHSQKCRAFLLDSGMDSEVGEDTPGPVLPKLKIRVICGLASLWVVQWETWAFEEEILRWGKEGKSVRPIRFIPVEDANHFLHWDDAETFIKICSDSLSS